MRAYSRMIVFEFLKLAFSESSLHPIATRSNDFGRNMLHGLSFASLRLEDLHQRENMQRATFLDTQ